MNSVDWVDLYLILIGIICLVLAPRPRVAPDEASPLAIFRRGMRLFCYVMGPAAILLGLRGILTGR